MVVNHFEKFVSRVCQSCLSRLFLLLSFLLCAFPDGASAFKDEIEKQYGRMQSRSRRLQKKDRWIPALAPQERILLAEKLHRAVARHREQKRLIISFVIANIVYNFK